MKDFYMVNPGNHLPILCYSLKQDKDRIWSLYDLSDRLRMRGWQVPTYPMPNDLDHLIVQRIVCRADFGMNNAIEFIEDMKIAIDELNNSKLISNRKEKHDNYGFIH